MPASNRINLPSLLCTCATHAVIVGGLLLSTNTRAPSALASREFSTPIVIDLIPLDQANGMRKSERQLIREMPPLPVSDAGATKQQAHHLSPVRPALATELSPSPEGHAAVLPARAETAAAAPAELSDYQRRLFEAVARNSRYPAKARGLRLSGITHLAFRIDRAGNVLDSWVQESSGSELLDTAALDALTRAQPLPPIPSVLPAEMDFVIEIDSSIMQRASSLTVG